MFNQPLVNYFSTGKQIPDTPFPRGGQTTSPWGTNEVPVGDKRDSRGGQTGILFVLSAKGIDIQTFANLSGKKKRQRHKNL